MNTTDRIRADSHRDPDALEREVDAQREHLASLVAALEQRLSPGEIANRVFGASKDGGKEFATNLSHTVRANPLPTLLTAAGMAWLYAQRDRPVERHAVETVGTGTARDGAGNGLRDKMSDTWDSTRDKAGSAKDFTRRKAQDARLGFDHMLEDNPIALGALGVAAGAMLGAMLPHTESEDRWLGEMRDRVADDLKHGAREATRSNGDARRGSTH